MPSIQAEPQCLQSIQSEQSLPRSHIYKKRQGEFVREDEIATPPPRILQKQGRRRALPESRCVVADACVVAVADVAAVTAGSRDGIFGVRDRKSSGAPQVTPPNLAAFGEYAALGEVGFP